MQDPMRAMMAQFDQEGRQPITAEEVQAINTRYPAMQNALQQQQVVFYICREKN